MYDRLTIGNSHIHWVRLMRIVFWGVEKRRAAFCPFAQHHNLCASGLKTETKSHWPTHGPNRPNWNSVRPNNCFLTQIKGKIALNLHASISSCCYCCSSCSTAPSWCTIEWILNRQSFLERVFGRRIGRYVPSASSTQSTSGHNCIVYTIFGYNRLRVCVCALPLPPSIRYMSVISYSKFSVRFRMVSKFALN